MQSLLKASLAVIFSSFIANAEYHYIEKIDVSGNQGIDNQCILSYLQKQDDKKYSDEDLDSALKKLHGTGFFSDVKLEISKKTLLVKVKENQIINQVAFEGNKKVTDDEIKSVVAIKSRDRFTEPRVKEEIQNILALYRTKGLYATSVTASIIKQSSNRINLIFQINEGTKAYIRNIFFVGNDKFSDSTLQGIISSKIERWYRFFSPPEEIYSAERVKYDEELLREYYLKNGYADIRVDAAYAELTADHKNFLLTYTVFEGQRYRFGKSSIQSEVPCVDTSFLNEDISWKEGDWFNVKSLQSVSDAIGNHLAEKGVFFVEVVPVTAKIGKCINVNFVIKSIDPKYIGKISINGNLGTDDKVIRRDLTFAEGDPFTPARISESERNLQELDYFEKIDISENSGGSKDLVDLIVKVKEKSTGDIQFGGGYSSTDGMIGKIGLMERNFLGKGHTVNLGAYLSKRKLDFDMGISTPYFMGRRVTVGADVLYSRYRGDTRNTFDKEGGYRQQTIGAGVHASYALRKRLYQGWGYKIRRDIFSFRTEGMSPYIADNMRGHTRQLVSTLSHDILYTRINSVGPEPTDGWLAKLSNEFSGLGGNIHFLSNKIMGKYYLSLDADEKIILRCDFTYGIIKKIGYMRFMDQYLLGGFSFPGFAETGIGPRDIRTGDALGGRQFYTLSAKLFFPLGFPKEFPVKGALHAHSGSLWSPMFKGKGIASNSFSNRVSVGGGIICALPYLGRIGVILSKVLVKKREDSKQTLLFIWGQEF